jgi:tRNA threonylcarbamoyladenosine biosynthesis protein TsaE
MMLHTIYCPLEEVTQNFAQQLAKCQRLCNACIELKGDLGSGKSTFARYLLKALGVQGHVKSPTYAVVEEYELDWPWSALNSAHPDDLNTLFVWHFDFYRFNNPIEWEEAGFKDIFMSPGLKISEWPERARGYLPSPDLELKFLILSDASREIQATAVSNVGEQMIGYLSTA